MVLQYGASPVPCSVGNFPDNRAMGIGNYIQTIGRGREGARALTREQACDLMGQILDGNCSDIETGAFCMAMRIKGETPEEMAGFLQATEQRLQPVQLQEAHPQRLPVLLPSYNGARRLPVLTPLLALLLARQGATVILHGCATESRRVFTSEVLSGLGIQAQPATQPCSPGNVHFVPTHALHQGLQNLLDARRLMQLRNPAHSLVKLLNPLARPCLLVTSYTHPEYASTMAQVLALRNSHAMLLRGTEGEAVADARRAPAMQCFLNGRLTQSFEAQSGALAQLPELPATCAAAATVQYIQAVLDGKLPVPDPIALQAARILTLCEQPAE